MNNNPEVMGRLATMALHHDSWIEVHDAVAELIAAADEAGMRLSLAMSHSEDLVAHMRLCAALARVQGESP